MSDVTLDRTAQAAAADAAGGATWQDYFALLKPRVMTLVVFSGFAGLIAAPGYLHPVLAATAVLCIAVGAGAAGAINMWYDRDIDAIMSRTRSRPIVRGLIAPAAPAPTAMHRIAVAARTGWMWPGATTSPAMPVNTTSVITRGFSSAK